VTYDELLAATEAPDDVLLRALWLARRGDWSGAHDLVGDLSGKGAARIHAYLHRVEGDLSNAQYWYFQAGSPAETGALDAEWEKLARELTGQPRAS